jgi:division protein CdvB (Snf7/Vps24/ESCRT-III family)
MKTTATLIPQDQVDDLIRQVADEYSLELHSLLPEIVQGFETFLLIISRPIVSKKLTRNC